MTLLEAASSTCRRLHDSPSTEEAYLHWIRELLRFHDGRHVRILGAAELTALLSHLAVDRRTSASTQNQALCAILFLDKRVLGLAMPDMEGLERAQLPEYLRAVLGLDRRDALATIEPPFRFIGEMLYGCGLRLLECLRVRIETEDVDLDRRRIMVRRGKGEVDRPALLLERRHQAEREAGRREVDLPQALRKSVLRGKNPRRHAARHLVASPGLAYRPPLHGSHASGDEPALVKPFFGSTSARIPPPVWESRPYPRG